MVLHAEANRRHGCSIAPMASMLTLLLVVSLSVASAHGHPLSLDESGRPSAHAHIDHGPAPGSCSICSITHHPVTAISSTPGVAGDGCPIRYRLTPAFPPASEPGSDERSPRAPPRSDIG